MIYGEVVKAGNERRKVCHYWDSDYFNESMTNGNEKVFAKASFSE